MREGGGREEGEEGRGERERDRSILADFIPVIYTSIHGITQEY